ncbi:lanthionine synthetase C family protein [Kitasatospora sp. NPDC101155]|uniref:lanthionine synthetase C family protein n=1 Tax=Kitasatospora sp. NPDC101155 TaxID=3364097 RepID=UPI00381A2AA8
MIHLSDHADTLTPLRERAAAAVAATAERLADPERVAAALSASGRPWDPNGLAGGAPGIALLYAELARYDDAFRATAHNWLSLASRSAHTAAPGTGLYDAVPALRFVLPRAAAGPQDYRSARTHLNGETAVLAERLARRERQRIADGAGHTTLESYDLISGLAGLGAALLDDDRPGTEEVLRALVQLSEPLAGLPGWWVAQDVRSYATVAPKLGHANLGLAHGAPGPLALLALAWRQGVRVPGQADAIARLAEWQLGRLRTDAAGPWWPASVELTPGQEAPGRPSWCYGSPGVARSLQLAGLALDVPDWRRTAEQALLAALARTSEHVGRMDPAGWPDADGRTDHHGLTDAGLCHGWGGLLQCAWRIAQDSSDSRVARRLPALAERMLQLTDPKAPFSFVPPRIRNGWTDDAAGFLTGAAGAALALHTFAVDRAPATVWDRALLLA